MSDRHEVILRGLVVDLRAVSDIRVCFFFFFFLLNIFSIRCTLKGIFRTRRISPSMNLIVFIWNCGCRSLVRPLVSVWEAVSQVFSEMRKNEGVKLN